MVPNPATAPGALPDEPNPDSDASASQRVPPTSGSTPESNPLLPTDDQFDELDGFELQEAPTASASARKGLREVVTAINWIIVNKRLRQAQAHQVCQVLRKLRLDVVWNLNPDDKSGLGFTRSIADCMGGHALNLRKVGVKRGGTVFELPAMPITPAWLAERGITLDLGTGS